MKKGKIVLLTVGLILNLMLASCAFGRNLRNAASGNPTGSSAPTTAPTLVVTPTAASSNQTPAAQSATSVQSQSVRNDNLDAISQDMQKISEPDVSVDTIETLPATDDLLDLNGLDQLTQDMQQVLDSLK
ncbi:MAG: hypothetical protein ABSA51_00115 [Anaerolineaceae bacterium]|jgi:hypothetical protein